jgi:hypothetical protein
MLKHLLGHNDFERIIGEGQAMGIGRDVHLVPGLDVESNQTFMEARESSPDVQAPATRIQRSEDFLEGLLDSPRAIVARVATLHHPAMEPSRQLAGFRRGKVRMQQESAAVHAKVLVCRSLKGFSRPTKGDPTERTLEDVDVGRRLHDCEL